MKDPSSREDVDASPHLLKDRYALGELLGRGSLGATYRAHDRLLGRAVAVKIVSERYADDTLFAERFMAAATAAGRLVHPNIVTVLDAGLVDGKPFVVTEFVDGRSLRDELQARGVLSAREGAEIAAQLAEAVGAAHRLRIVHGDIRPENVLLDGNGGAKLGDFGFVRAAVSTDMTLIGTVQRAAYVPPEYAVRDTADEHVDVYGLGAVLYEMLTCETPRATLSAGAAPGMVRATLPPLRRRRPDVPARIEHAVMRALAADPRARFASAADFRAALIGQPPGASDRASFATAATSQLPATTGPTARVPASASPHAAAPASAQSWRAAPRHRDLGGGAGVGGMLVGAIPIIATMALLGGAILLLTGFLPRMFNNLQITDVPSLVDYDLAEATSIAEAHGLGVAVAGSIPTDDRPRGSVISQDPAAEKRVRRGIEVKLTVSGGMRPPSVVGKPVDEARAILVRAGWSIGAIENKPDANGAVGTVVATTPGGQELAANRQQPIGIVVSSGKPIANVAVGRPLRLSSARPGPASMVDDNVETAGVVEVPAPFWVEFELEKPSTVTSVELVTYQGHPADTVHEVWFWTTDNQFRGMHTFVGPTDDRKTLTITLPQPMSNVRAIRIATTQASATPGWREIRVLAQ